MMMILIWVIFSSLWDRSFWWPMSANDQHTIIEYAAIKIYRPKQHKLSLNAYLGHFPWHFSP